MRPIKTKGVSDNSKPKTVFFDVNNKIKVVPITGITVIKLGKGTWSSIQI